MTRAVALSDPAVIYELNKNFVAVEFNLSDESFPAELGGLSPWQEGYERDLRYAVGFATTIVLDPEGVSSFGTSGCGHRGELDTSINYDPPRFLEYLQASRERYQREKQALENSDLVTVGKVQAEVKAQIHEANRCFCRVKKEMFPSTPWE